MNFRLYRFDKEPTPTSPVAMNELVGMGHYLNAENAMRYLRRLVPENPTMFYNGQPATHLGLYDWNDKLVHTERL